MREAAPAVITCAVVAAPLVFDASGEVLQYEKDDEVTSLRLVCTCLLKHTFVFL